MPHKLKNGKYAFKGGCIGEKGTDGKYTLVAMRNNNIKGKKRRSEKKETQNKKRRSRKKTFSSKQMSYVILQRHT